LLIQLIIIKEEWEKYSRNLCLKLSGSLSSKKHSDNINKV